MGDRRNVVVEFPNDLSVALYTHWDGTNLPETVAKALTRGKDRWNDAPYLTRIIFSEMVQGSVLDTTGYGIEPIMTGSVNYTEANPGYDLVVSVNRQMVSVWDDEHGTVNDFEFAEFVSLYL